VKQTRLTSASVEGTLLTEQDSCWTTVKHNYRSHCHSLGLARRSPQTEATDAVG